MRLQPSCMHDSERRALTRAAGVLLALSIARWAISRPADPGTFDEAPNVLPAHVAATEAAADEAARRRRPLEAGERIDPNHASELELDRLPGIGPSTAAAIVRERDRGAVFRRPEELTVVRGIGPATVERLRPWLEFAPSVRGRPGERAGGRLPRTDRRYPTVLDVNRAGIRELEALPGVGPALARRIVEERAIRPFSSVDDLARVRGIGPATIARLRGAIETGATR